MVERQTRGAFGLGSWAYDVSAFEGYGGALADYGAFNGGNAQHLPAHRDPFGFGGQWGYQTDRETGLSLLTHRYYDAGAGRFLSRDPAGYGGGINLYAYAGNNPVNEIDPSGLIYIRPGQYGSPSLLGRIRGGAIQFAAGVVEGGRNLGQAAENALDFLGNLVSDDNPADCVCAEAPGQNSASRPGNSQPMQMAGRRSGREAAEGVEEAPRLFDDAELGTITSKLPKNHLHHLLPKGREFRRFWRNAGLNEHDYTVGVTKAEHDVIHTGDAWEKEWRVFLRDHPSASGQDIMDQMFKMKRQWGLSGRPHIKYKR